jgi:hypothetical protein
MKKKGTRSQELQEFRSYRNKDRISGIRQNPKWQHLGALILQLLNS